MNISIKFVGRYVPSPKPRPARGRKDTIKHTRTDPNIVEDDESFMDEILDDEEEELKQQIGGGISEIRTA